MGATRAHRGHRGQMRGCRRHGGQRGHGRNMGGTEDMGAPRGMQETREHQGQGHVEATGEGPATPGGHRGTWGGTRGTWGHKGGHRGCGEHSGDLGTHRGAWGHPEAMGTRGDLGTGGPQGPRGHAWAPVGWARHGGVPLVGGAGCARAVGGAKGGGSLERGIEGGAGPGRCATQWAGTEPSSRWWAGPCPAAGGARLWHTWPALAPRCTRGGSSLVLGALGVLEAGWWGDGCWEHWEMGAGSAGSWVRGAGTWVQGAGSDGC